MKYKKIFIVLIGLVIVFTIVIHTTNVFQPLLHLVSNIDKFRFSRFMELKNSTYSDSFNDIFSVSKSITHSKSKKIKSFFISKDRNTAFQLGFKHCNKSFQATHYITVQDTIGQLANNVFRLFALLSTAKDHCYTPVITDKLFHITTELLDLPNMKKITDVPKQWKIFKELSYGKYSLGIMTLDHHSNWSLQGYLQSWRYFNKHDAYIRSVLQFKREVREPVIKYINNFRNKTTICVHSRRGDFLMPTYQRRGFGVAGIGYFNKAMQYFLNKFKDTPVAFIILSDDIEWCKKNFKNDTGNVHFSPFSLPRSANSAAKDMALMTHCDNSIISSGTFGWIGAWLGNGHVVYFKGYPTNGTEMDRFMNRDDYYRSDWVGMM